MDQIDNDKEQMIDDWSALERSDIQCHRIIFNLIAFLSSIALIIAPIVYQSQIPSNFYLIVIICGITSTITASALFLFRNSQNQLFSSFLFSASALIICMMLTLSLFIWIQIDIDLNYLTSNSQSLYTHQEILLLIIILSIFASIVSFSFLLFGVYINMQQQSLMMAQHYFNQLFLLSGVILHYLTFKDQGALNVWLLSFGLLLAILTYGVNLWKLKVGYFAIAMLFLIYIIFGQILHFKEYRHMVADHQLIMDNCANELRNTSEQYLNNECGCPKFKKTTTCPFTEQFLDTELHCLNMDCCQILSDRRTYKQNNTNIVSVCHILISFVLFGLMLYISQKPPFIKFKLNTLDFLIGMSIVAILILSSIGYSSLNQKYQNQHLDPQCRNLFQYTNFKYLEDNQWMSLNIRVHPPTTLKYSLSNHKDIIQYPTKDINTLKLEGKYYPITKYLNSIKICSENQKMDVDIVYHKLSDRNLHEVQVYDILNFKLHTLSLKLNVSKFTIKLFKRHSLEIYMEVDDQNIINNIQEQQYLLIIQAKGYENYRNNISVTQNYNLDIKLRKINSKLQVVLYSEQIQQQQQQQSLLGAKSLIQKCISSFLSQQCENLSYQNSIDFKQQQIDLNTDALIYIMNPKFKDQVKLYYENELIYEIQIQDTQVKNNLLVLICIQGLNIYEINQPNDEIIPNYSYCDTI